MKKSDKFCWICPIFCKEVDALGDNPYADGGGSNPALRGVGGLVGADVVDDPGTDFFGAVAGATLYLDFGSAHVGIERGVDCLADELALFSEVEVFEEHCHGEDLR